VTPWSRSRPQVRVSQSILSPFRQNATATDFVALGVGMVCWRRSPQLTTPVVVVFLL